MPQNTNSSIKLKKPLQKSFIDFNAVNGIKLCSCIHKTSYFILSIGNYKLIGDDYESSIENIIAMDEHKFKELFYITFCYQFLSGAEYEINFLMDSLSRNVKKLYQQYYCLYKEFYKLELFRFNNSKSIQNFSTTLDFKGVAGLNFIEYLDLKVNNGYDA